MSTGPRRSVTLPSIRPTWSGWVTSRSTAIASPPESLISAATASERSRVRAARATLAPTSTRARAKASPRPVLPPVTTAVLPVRSKASRTAIPYLLWIVMLSQLDAPKGPKPKGFRPLRARHARLRGLTGEEPCLIPHQDNSLARRVGRHADQLPALPGARVHGLLELRDRE